MSTIPEHSDAEIMAYYHSWAANGRKPLKFPQRLMNAWRERSDEIVFADAPGREGLTLPFIVGADAKRRKKRPTSEDVERIAKSLRETGLWGWWCPNVQAPVFRNHTQYDWGSKGLRLHATHEFSEYVSWDEVETSLSHQDATDLLFAAIVADAKRHLATPSRRYINGWVWAPFSKEDRVFISAVVDEHRAAIQPRLEVQCVSG